MLGRVRRFSMLAVVLGCSLPAMADSLSFNFNSDSVGGLPAGWTDPSNAATSAKVVNLSPGNNGLYVYNNGNGNNGVINNVLSPHLTELAGEMTGNVQPGAVWSRYLSSYMFRTASTGPVTGFQFKSESYGQDRTTWLKFYNDGAGALKVDYSGVTSGNTANSDVFNDNFGQFHTVSSLTWGAWYRVETWVDMVDGSSNDVIHVNVYDASNNLVWNAVDTTWEQYYRLDSEQAGNGNVVPGLDAIQFQMRGSTADNLNDPSLQNGVIVDNVSIATVPLPGSAWMGLGLIGGLAVMRLRRKARLA
jgi:hypothetical protein